ncbi:GUN4 domain-containing protein [Dapis sp. BLCC M229]|uniref:GUN4 domain-containing protein n=1 Tax=Dapis sp. BLCC M229 TaxID=3400188 RepID=UPI003CF0602C
MEIFPSDIDLALVTFKPERGSCNYPALKIGNSDNLRKGSSIYISGFPIRGGKLVSQFVPGDVSGLESLARGYGVSYDALTVGGMSGAPVADVTGEVVAVHGMSDVEIVKTFASLQGSWSKEEQQTYQKAVERLEKGVERLTFSWGIPINLFQEYRGKAITLGIYKQKVELQRQLEEEQQQRQKAEKRVQELEQEQKAKQEQIVELQKQLKEEQRQRQDAERQLRELKAEKQRQVENEISLDSAKEVDYTKLRDLLAAGHWKEADLETDRVILQVAGRESEGWLRYEDVKNFSCQDLGTIDKLWVKYSNGKFGFSVQKQIYQSMGGTKKYNKEVWIAFGNKVGWRKGGKWLSYDSLSFSDKHYKGHLPWGVWAPPGGGYRCGTSSLVRKLVNFNI